MIARYAFVAAVALALDLTPQNGGCCASTTTDPPVLFEFAHACTADSQCNGGLQCLQTEVQSDGATCVDGGAGTGACTQPCATDADCREFSEYSMAFCAPCAAAGATRVCIH